MSVEVVTTLFALLSVLCLLLVVGVALAAVVGRVRGGLPPALAEVRDGVAELAVPLALAVAATSTLGSLYLSESAKFTPCELCWYQRICMYPLTVLLGVAWVRGRDLSVRWYVWPLTAVGLGISVYHYLVERFPDTVSSSCSSEVPCSFVWVWKFHFLSIPAMAGTGFLTIATLLAVAAASRRAGGTVGGPSDGHPDRLPGGAPSDAPSDDRPPMPDEVPA